MNKEMEIEKDHNKIGDDPEPGDSKPGDSQTEQGSQDEDFQLPKETQDVNQKEEFNLEQELEKCRREAENYLNDLQWVTADFENYRKRVEKNRKLENFIIRKEFLLGLLPVVDDLERGLNQARNGSQGSVCQDIGEANPGQTEESLIQGMDLIYQNMQKFLLQNNVKKIDCLNSKFDPYLHEALMTEHSDKHEEDTILTVFQTGYKLNDETLRAAKVKVSTKEV